MTLRDRVWDASLTMLVNRGKFKLKELPVEESERHTARRVLRTMIELGWVKKESKHAAIYRLGPKGELLLDVDEETIQAANS
ncbi:hypothetical protein [Halorubrum sp. SP3]|uniref:hypothetical protein n=1 Tax=Halorubrum sp. SP3 TaxID=1537265 RepID=UPI0018EE9EB5|nr:hypothetical protein [Halorubrum sp. SP3]